MAVNEVSSLIRYKDENGNHNILYPITTKDNVDGIDDIEAAVAETVKFTNQNLTDAQKAQARENIGVKNSTVTHSWDGTTLNVTTDSGSSSSDLKGEKGDAGVSIVSIHIEEV